MTTADVPQNRGGSKSAEIGLWNMLTQPDGTEAEYYTLHLTPKHALDTGHAFPQNQTSAGDVSIT